MDHFADLPEFTDLGEPADHEYLDAVLQKTCQQMFDRVIKISDCLLIYIAQYHLFHGAFQVEGRIGSVIYFEDIKFGLIAVSVDYPATNVVKYSRFSEMIQLSAPQGNDYN